MIEQSAIILSGGMNRRMNYINKAFLRINGESLIETIIKKVSMFKEILIVTNTPSDYSHLGVKVVTDIIPNCGPLSGIHSGLTHSQYQYSFVLPCDMPFITSDALKYMSGLAQGYDIVVPKINHYFQPLCGVYSKSCIDPIEECLREKIYKLIDLYPFVHVRQVEKQEMEVYGEIEVMFRNINKPGEYLELCEERGNIL
jgi:molybdopterin-guanine dinucleotide biosynthesis protein A